MDVLGRALVFGSCLISLASLSCVEFRKDVRPRSVSEDVCWTVAQNAVRGTSIHHLGDRVVVGGPDVDARQEFRVPSAENRGCVRPFGEDSWVVYQPDYGSIGYIWREKRWVAVDPNTAWHPDVGGVRADLFLGISEPGEGRISVSVDFTDVRASCSATLQGVGRPAFRVWWIAPNKLVVEGEWKTTIVGLAVEQNSAGGPSSCELYPVSSDSETIEFKTDGPTDRYSQYRELSHWSGDQ